LIFFCFLFVGSIAIVKGQWIEPSAADLEGAWEININQTYTFERSPIGFGNIKEFKPEKGRSSYLFFKEERNTVWISFEVPYDGKLLFEISPYQFDDDYDWMLFAQTDSLAKCLLNKSVTPIRSNNARNNKDIGAKTGIQDGFENLYEKPGPGLSYSSPLQVKEGEKYFLIVDNIYAEGKGFDLKIQVSPNALYDDSTFVYGVVKNKINQKPIIGDITLEDDSTAFIFEKITTDSLGKYRIKVPLYRPLNLTASAKNHLFNTEDFTIEESGEMEINFNLDSIGHNRSINLFNVHFPPNSDHILPSSFADLDRLLQFLIENQEWGAKIIGHSNSNVWANEKFLQKLSMKRAIAVKTYLIQNGVDEDRLSCIGMGGKRPLIKTNDANLGIKNLRVSVY